MRRRPWMRISALSLALLLSALAPAADAPGREGVKAGESASGVPEPKGRAAEIPSMKSVDLSGAWRVLWGVLGIGGLAIAAAFLWRKYGSRTARAPAGEGLQVLGRAALSPRHHVFVLRFGDRKVLVGVSGDRMASLAVVEDGPAPGSRGEAMFSEKRVSERGATESGIGSSRGTVSEADLVPYRKQVDRLRGLLRGRPAAGD